MKNTIIPFILFIIIIGSSCGGTNQLATVTDLGKELKWLEGEWLGTGYQLDAYSNSTWPIELNINLDKKTCQINYPTLDCSGKWQLVNGNYHSATFMEKITEGKTKCYSGGKLVLTLVDENHLSYSFFYPDSGKLGASSTLINKKWGQKMNSTQL